MCTHAYMKQLSKNRNKQILLHGAMEIARPLQMCAVIQCKPLIRALTIVHMKAILEEHKYRPTYICKMKLL